MYCRRSLHSTVTYSIICTLNNILLITRTLQDVRMHADPVPPHVLQSRDPTTNFVTLSWLQEGYLTNYSLVALLSGVGLETVQFNFSLRSGVPPGSRNFTGDVRGLVPGGTHEFLLHAWSGELQSNGSGGADSTTGRYCSLLR